MDEMKGPTAANDRIGGDVLIKRSQLSLTRAGEGQEITICNMPGVEKTLCVYLFGVQQ